MVTGGSYEGLALKSCEWYLVKSNRWKPAVEMNHGRLNHASCYLSRTVYVFCGQSRTTLTQIERLNLDRADLVWEEIPVSISDLAPRCLPVVTPIGDSSIVILGGYEGNSFVNDVVHFNTQPANCKKVLERQLDFYAFGNQTAMVGPSLVALVKARHAPCIVAYSPQSRSLKTVHELPCV